MVGNAWENQLCVPDDNLDDLEFFPNFLNDPIKLPVFADEDWDVDMYSDEKSKSETQVSGQCSMSPDLSHDSQLLFSGQEQEFEGMARKKVSGERRRCSHCETEKTPKWRKGPDGLRTLCNACGVRYKSGRLVPEYRPAASPSFKGRKHSNFHKNMVEKKTPRQ